LANEEIVKKLITYRGITVAIGILVALVIVLTLWVKKPGHPVSGFNRTPQPEMPLSVKNVLETTFSLLQF
jgi:hypothetical protein